MFVVTEAFCIDSADLKRRLRTVLFEIILPFWCGPALDREQGGWMAWLDNDLTPDRTRPKGLVLHSRVLWTFSAVHRLQPDPLYRQMAFRAFDYLMDRFLDKLHGGAVWQLDDQGQVRDGAKIVYGQAFLIYALAEFYLAFDLAPALARAVELWGLVEVHARDAAHGGYIEGCGRDWAGVRQRWVWPGRVTPDKTMNTQLHVLEAWTCLYRAAPSAALGLRLRELISIFLRHIRDHRTGHLHPVFDGRWRVRSQATSYGHDIEASWLLCEAAAELGDPDLLSATREAALATAAVTLAEGVGADGGLYHAGKEGRVVDFGREYWPQAEAFVGFLNAFQLGSDSRFLHAAERVWRFVEDHLVDRVNGDLFWRINPDGRPDPTLPKVSEWKGPYHTTRACLEGVRRL